MKNTNKIFFASLTFLMTLMLTGRKFIIEVFAAEYPFCDDVTARIDEDVYCRIEVNNSYFDNLNSAHINIDIPNDVTFAVTDEDWTCVSNANNISCDKTYSVAFPKDTFDYVDVVFGSNYAGKYNIESTVSGTGVNTIDILYDDSIDIDYETMWCGDGECYDVEEDVESCPTDCGECGDGICSGPWEVETCPEDCESGDCGDGWCDWESGEDWESCPLDCELPS